jgi:hypothetical protein
LDIGKRFRGPPKPAILVAMETVSMEGTMETATRKAPRRHAPGGATRDPGSPRARRFHGHDASEGRRLYMPLAAESLNPACIFRQTPPPAGPALGATP